ncbi:MAG: hypothetical protein IJ658_12030 [Kiritimatiellae bacterium]|nr:hypothetical protein [Kiritimatiellia bacterium]
MRRARKGNLGNGDVDIPPDKMVGAAGNVNAKRIRAMRCGRVARTLADGRVM